MPYNPALTFEAWVIVGFYEHVANGRNFEFSKNIVFRLSHYAVPVRDSYVFCCCVQMSLH